MDRLTEMNCFVKTVEEGSFAAAGRALGLPPQTVGKHVAALEARLRTQLLYRTTRNHSLTEIGRAFYERCRNVLKDAEDAETSVAEYGGAPRGQLIVGAPKTFGSLRLMPFVTDYLDHHKGVSIKLVLTDRLVDLIGEGFDALLRIGPLEDSSLLVRHLAPCRLVPCASPDYLADRGVPSSPADLAVHECLVFNYWSKPPLTTWAFERDGQTETVAVGGKLQVNDGKAVIEAAVSGHGIVLQDAELVKDDLAAGRLVRLLPDYDGPTRPLNLLYPRGRTTPPKLQTFIQAVCRHFGR